MRTAAKKRLTRLQLKAMIARDLARKRAQTVKRRERIFHLRAQGLSQQAISDIVGCSQRYVSTLLGESAAPAHKPSLRERIVHKETIGNLAILISSRHVYARVELSQ